MNKIAYNPESIEKLQARYADAIMYTWVHNRPNDAPGLHPEHIFDCEDGISLIINKECFGPVDTIHFSCAVNKERYEKAYNCKFIGAINSELLSRMEQRFREISGEKEKPLHLATVAPIYGTPHFLLIEPGMLFGLALPEEMENVANQISNQHADDKFMAPPSKEKFTA